MKFPAPDTSHQIVAELAKWSVELSPIAHYTIQIVASRGKTIGFQPEATLDNAILTVEIDPAKLQAGTPLMPAFIYDTKETPSSYVIGCKMMLAGDGQPSASVLQTLEAAVTACFDSNWRLMSQVFTNAGLLASPRSTPAQNTVSPNGPKLVPSVDLLSWDLACGISIDHINKYLADSADKFAATFADNDGNFSGTIGTWRILPDGTERLLKMAVGIRSGSSAGMDLSGVELKFQLDLDFLPSKDTANSTKLTFNLDGDSSHIVPLSVTKNEEPAKADLSALVKSFLPKALEANAGDLRYVLASAALGMTPGSWLDAKYWDYVYFAPRACLTVLASVSGTAPGEAQVDPALFAQATGVPDEVFIAVGKDQFMQHVIIPGLRATYPKAPADAFALDPHAMTVSARKSFPVDDQATLTSLVVDVEDSIARISTTGSAQVGVGSRHHVEDHIPQPAHVRCESAVRSPDRRPEPGYRFEG